MIYHGEKKIAKIFHGDREISRIYRGDKLVFQNKLIPGVDYEKYQWLDSNDAYIMYDYKFYLSYDFYAKVKVKNYNSSFYNLGSNFSERTEPDADRLALSISANSFYIDWGAVYDERRESKKWPFRNSVNKRLTPGEVGEIIFTQTQGVVFGKATAKKDNVYGHINCYPLLAFGVFKYGKIVMPNRSLIPIQLIRNIPQYLSINNKPHLAGECGMFDEISGKFYGNANSTGAFSVSND